MGNPTGNMVSSVGLSD